MTPTQKKLNKPKIRATPTQESPTQRQDISPVRKKSTRKSQQTKNEPSTTSHVSFTHFRSNGSQEMWLTLLASPRLCRRFPRFPGVSVFFLVLFLVWRRLFWGPIPASSSSWTSDCQRGNVNRIALCGFNLWQNI